MTRQPLVRAIYDGESYDVRIVDYETQVEHVLDVNNPGRRCDDDSKIVAFYAVFWIDGTSVVHFMPRAEVDAIRDKHSKSNGTWSTHYREMGFKTVIRQMISRGVVPVSYDQAEKMRRAQAVEVIEDASANSQVIDAQTWSVLSQDEPPTSDDHPTIPAAVGHDAGSESDGQMGDRQ
jgi:recombinational DNA repair protein RecT